MIHIKDVVFFVYIHTRGQKNIQQTRPLYHSYKHKLIDFTTTYGGGGPSVFFFNNSTFLNVEGGPKNQKIKKQPKNDEREAKDPLP